MRTSIDPTTLRELLRYDAGDGVLYWRERDSKFFQPTEKREASGHAKWWNGRFAGKRACKSDCNRGYLRVCLFGDEYPAHRVIWAMETGQWPTNVIDHIDGDPANNRIANLRSATTAENNRNKANHGRSRFRGVSWRARQSIWVSAIKTNKKVTFLGCYKNEEDAARAYDVAAIEQHGNFARTNFPRADYDARIRSALVEVPAVKGEPIGLCYRYEPDLPWHVVESENQLPKPRKHFPLLEVRTVYTAPPADAGMREALAAVTVDLVSTADKDEDPFEWASVKQSYAALGIAPTAPGATTKSDGGWNEAIEACIQAVRQTGNFGDYKREELTADYGRPKFDMMNAIINALTALRSGALTKSDGGGESRPANPGTGGRAPCIEQTTPATMPAQAGVAPGPSDPSSTRSEVTVEELALFIERDFDYDHPARRFVPSDEWKWLARALLEQFEIRRK